MHLREVLSNAQHPGLSRIQEGLAEDGLSVARV